ncbi:hypothetical protein TIFTF001_012518 [Ficus carica]|uniref:Uncharacterized protein n=1 Tax=Ficus carica TaxID=3494 RepID=A0AA88A050_FICCA|nr:hypothetical protein TIFTF001_012518 [Ficus carica]
MCAQTHFETWEFENSREDTLVDALAIPESEKQCTAGFWWWPWACLWFLGPRDECENYMMRVLIEVSPWHEDVCCEKDQGSNEIVDGGASSSHTDEVVYPPSALVVYLSDLSFDGILVPLELLSYGVSSDPCAAESWPSIEP